MKIVLVDLGAPDGRDLAGSLRDVGHVVRVASGAADAGLPWTDFAPDVLVVRLEADAAAGLDLAAAIAAKPTMAGAPLLVTGSNEVALEAARRRFPEASFARLDHVVTALASIEADE